MSNYLSRYLGVHGRYWLVVGLMVVSSKANMQAMAGDEGKEIRPLSVLAMREPKSWDDVLVGLLEQRCPEELWQAYKTDAARLVMIGASPNVSDSHGRTLFNKAVEFDDSEYVDFLLMMLEEQKRKNESLFFNSRAHDQLNQEEYNALLNRESVSPFFDVKSEEMMEKLLRAGGDVNFIGMAGSRQEGRSVLHAACAPDVPAEVVVLAANSMVPKAKTSRAPDGNTPLHELALQASFYGDSSCGDLYKKGEVLVRHIPIESKNGDGLMAVQLLQVAPTEKAISKKMLRLLLEAEYAKKPWYERMLSGWW